MGTYTPDQYQKLWRKRAVMLRRVAMKSTRDASSFMVATAKGMAPVKSGDLREGIIAKPIKDAEWEVSSSVPNDFPYQFWINQTAPYRTLHFGEKGGWIPPNRSYNGRWTRVFPPNSNIVYGDGSHRNTGTPRFWHFATLRTWNMFGRMTRKNVQNVLKVRI